jgi:hypothetical protein
MESDTRIGPRDDDATHVLYLVTGQRLRIVTGPMRGLKGRFVERRPGGVLLIGAGGGMYVEVSEFCVTPEGEKSRT